MARAHIVISEDVLLGPDLALESSKKTSEVIDFQNMPMGIGKVKKFLELLCDQSTYEKALKVFKYNQIYGLFEKYGLTSKNSDGTISPGEVYTNILKKLTFNDEMSVVHITSDLVDRVEIRKLFLEQEHTVLTRKVLVQNVKNHAEECPFYFMEVFGIIQPYTSEFGNEQILRIITPVGENVFFTIQSKMTDERKGVDRPVINKIMSLINFQEYFNNFGKMDHSTQKGPITHKEEQPKSSGKTIEHLLNIAKWLVILAAVVISGYLYLKSDGQFNPTKFVP